MVNDTQQIPAGYKQTDVGVIPEDWEVMPMAQMNFDISDGNYSSKYPKSSDFKSMGIPFIRANNIKRMTVIDDDMRFITKSQHAQLKKGHLKKNDVLITTRGEIGQIAFVPDEYVDANINAQIVRINTANSGISSQFFGYYLTQDSIQNSFENSQSGSALKQLPVGKLVRLLVVIPSKKEQEKISEALLSIDSLISKLDQLIQKKKSIKQGAMQELLTGKTRLPGFSGEWEEKSLGDFGKCLRGVSYKPEFDLYPHDTDTTFRLLRSNNVQEGRIVFENMQFVSGSRVSQTQFLRSNDILICMANGSRALVGKSALFSKEDSFQYTFGAFMGCFRIDSQLVNKSYLRYLFETEKYRLHIDLLLSGSSINNLRPSDIESFLHEIPTDIKEQKAISNVLFDLDAELDLLEKQKLKYQDLKQGMMQQLLTGKIRLV